MAIEHFDKKQQKSHHAEGVAACKKCLPKIPRCAGLKGGSVERLIR